MKAIILIISLLMISAVQAQQKAGSQTQQLTYTCPMHPAIQQHAPGTCPQCHMQLVAMKEQKTDSTAQKAVCPMHPDQKINAKEGCPLCKGMMKTKKEIKNGSKDQQYTCPMHGDVKQSNPGQCPHCKMALVKTSDSSSHQHH